MEQNTQEWLEFRKNKIGGSDCPSILGISPYQTAFQLWEEKVLGKEKEQNGAMRRGQMLEAKARAAFEATSGLSMMPKVVVSGARNWQMASLDGISFDGSSFVEIKCPNKEVHEMAKNGKLPPHYYAQMQHQMCVLEVGMGFYFSFNGEEGVIVEVKDDEEYIENLIKKEEAFFECMKSKEPPALTDQDYTVKDNLAWAQLTEEWKQISANLKGLEEKEQEVRKLLISMAEGRNSRGNGVRVTKSIYKGSVEYKSIPELMGVNLDTYRKPSSERWTIASSK